MTYKTKIDTLDRLIKSNLINDDDKSVLESIKQDMANLDHELDKIIMDFDE